MTNEDPVVGQLRNRFQSCEVEYGRNGLKTIQALKDLAFHFREANRPEESCELLEDVLDRTIDALGFAHRDVYWGMGSLGYGYYLIGRFDRCLELKEAMLTRYREELGATHPFTQSVMCDLSCDCLDGTHHQRAFELRQELFMIHVQNQGLYHRDTLMSLMNLAGCYSRLELDEDAVIIDEFVSRLLEGGYGLAHRDTLMSLMNLGIAYSDVGRHDEAKACFRKILSADLNFCRPPHCDSREDTRSAAADWLSDYDVRFGLC
jgi:tetratricopeptide (TPR) repeat protein